MKVETSPRFNRDLRRIRDPALAIRVNRKIDELEAAASMREVSAVSRVHAPRGWHYRIRVGEYRIGVTLEGDTAVLARFGHRSVIYRVFP